MKFPQAAFKIAAQLIQERLQLPQTAEPADISPEGQQANQNFVPGDPILTLLGNKSPVGTASAERAPSTRPNPGRGRRRSRFFMTMVLKDLATESGINELIGVTGGTQSFYNQPSRALGVKKVVQSAIADDPSLARVKVQIMPNLPDAMYDYGQNKIILGLTNPDALAHELGHVNNLKDQGLYQKVLRAAKGVSRLNNLAAIPTTLALRLFLKDPEQRTDILNTLSAVSSAVAAPGLLEEASASIQALKHSPDKLKALQTLGPAFLSHAANSMAPALIYQAGRL